jgi:hypothetical protein
VCVCVSVCVRACVRACVCVRACARVRACVHVYRARYCLEGEGCVSKFVQFILQVPHFLHPVRIKALGFRI